MDTSPSKPGISGATAMFRIVAYIEAGTYLLLLAATLWHRGFDGPDLVGVLGPVHGIAFLVYFALVLTIRESQGWGLWRTVAVLGAAILPFGGFWAGRHLSTEPVTAS